MFSIEKINRLVKSKIIRNKLKIKKKINEEFDTEDPKSIYGFTEISIRDAHKGSLLRFNLKYIINRCELYRAFTIWKARPRFC